VAYDLASQNYARARELIASSAISQAEYDNVEGGLKKAETDLRLAAAQLEKCRIKYADMLVRAPFDGIITARAINPGEYANPQAAAMVMVNLSQVAIKTSASDQQINKLHPGQDIRVKIKALPSQVFTGQVTNVSLAPDPASKSYPVKIKIDNTDQLLKPGMFGEAYLQEKQEGLLIPLTALTKDQSGTYVFVEKQGKACKTPVTTGLADNKNIIVNTGLQEGDQVIVSNLNLLKDGQKVVVK
jgi:cobalt-zinc-cadmium efflux system membrane fusion protein